jgi:hypothetical protein
MSHGTWDRGRDSTNSLLGAALINYGRVDLDFHNRDSNTKMLAYNRGLNLDPSPNNIDYRPRRLGVQSTQAVQLSPTLFPWNTRDSIIIAKLKGTDVLYNTRIIADGNLATCEGGIRIFQSDASTHKPVLSKKTTPLSGTMRATTDSNTLGYGRFSISGPAAQQNWRIGDWVEISGVTGAGSSVNGLWQVSLEDISGNPITDEIAHRSVKTSINSIVLTDESGTKCPFVGAVPDGTNLTGEIILHKKAEGCPLLEIATLTGVSSIPVTTPNPIHQSYAQGPYLAWYHDGKTIYELVQIAYREYLGQVSANAWSQIVFGNCWQTPPKENDDFYIGFSFNQNPTLDVGIGSFISFSVEYITD